jgi:hypothetical protein
MVGGGAAVMRAVQRYREFAGSGWAARRGSLGAALRLTNCSRAGIRTVGASHRRLEWQTFAAIVLVIHRPPVIVWLLVRELLQVCAALAASTDKFSTGMFGLPVWAACVNTRD